MFVVSYIQTCFYFHLDVNERGAGGDSCAQICTNTFASFYCECNSGYLLDAVMVVKKYTYSVIHTYIHTCSYIHTFMYT